MLVDLTNCNPRALVVDANLTTLYELMQKMVPGGRLAEELDVSRWSLSFGRWGTKLG